MPLSIYLLTACTVFFDMARLATHVATVRQVHLTERSFIRWLDTLDLQPQHGSANPLDSPELRR